MDKKLLAFLCITAILVICGTVFMALYYNPDKLISPEGFGYRGMTPFQPDTVLYENVHTRQAAPVMKFVAGVCALFLVGYLFLFFYRRFKSDASNESIALEATLYKISVETGRTEYELFLIAAEGWSVSEKQINADFKNYMADYVLPFYVMDFLRKNYNHIDQSLRKREEVVEPTSVWDLVKAILIFPGCVFLLPFLGIIFGYNYLR